MPTCATKARIAAIFNVSLEDLADLEASSGYLKARAQAEEDRQQFLHYMEVELAKLTTETL